jgi:hypothetical protein
LVSLGSRYVYIALLFSFTYYGIARVSGVLYSWTDALIASLFIPFFVTELPKLPVFRILGGLHCSLILAIGFGTFPIIFKVGSKQSKLLRRKLTRDLPMRLFVKSS